MDKDKQIEEMAQILGELENKYTEDGECGANN